MQKAVAAVVPERVVDLFKAVEVEQQHAEHLLVASRREQRLAQSVTEETSVGQSGQRVVQRLVLERIGMRLALRDVTQCRDEQVTRSDLHRADDELERKQASVLALAHRLVRGAHRDVELQPALEVVDERAAVRGRDHDVGALSDELLLRITEQLDDRRVGRLDGAGAVDGEQSVRHVVKHRPRALLALLQRDLRALAFDVLANLRTDVVHHREKPVVELARRRFV